VAHLNYTDTEALQSGFSAVAVSAKPMRRREVMKYTLLMLSIYCRQCANIYKNDAVTRLGLCVAGTRRHVQGQSYTAKHGWSKHS